MKHIACTAALTSLSPELRASLCRDPERGYTAREVMLWAIATQPQFTESMPGLLSAQRIDTAARKDAAPIVIDNEDHERLVRAIAEPRGGYPLSPPLALLLLLQEIQSATDEPPETP